MTEPTPRDPVGRRPLPARADWRRALNVYRGGRSRSLTFDEKRRIAAAADEAPAEGAAKPRDGGGAARPAHTTAPGFGVPVPRTFAFHRNAGNWRDRLPGERTHGDDADD